MLTAAQQVELAPDLTVAENIVLGIQARRGWRRRIRRSEQQLVVDNYIKALDVRPADPDQLVGNLSGGNPQQGLLARWLATSPRLIVLDEPTNGVDPVSRREFWEILYSLQLEGVTILISTSYLDEAERCHRVGLLHQGRLLLCDRPEALKGNLHRALIAVTSPEPRAVLELLERAEGVSTAVLVGNGVHLVVDDAARRMPELRSRLEAAGVPVEEIAQAAPSIEDLFVSVVTEQGDEAA